MTTSTTFVCKRHPHVRVELHIRGDAICTRCSRRLRPVAVQLPLFKETRYAQ